MTVILRFYAEFGSFTGRLRQSGRRKIYTICDGNVVQRIYFLVIYHLWRYSQRLLRTSALLIGTCAVYTHCSIMTLLKVSLWSRFDWNRPISTICLQCKTLISILCSSCTIAKLLVSKHVVRAKTVPWQVGPLLCNHETRAQLLLRWPRSVAQFEFRCRVRGNLSFQPLFRPYSLSLISENVTVGIYHIGLLRKVLFGLRCCRRQYGSNFNHGDVPGGCTAAGYSWVGKWSRPREMFRSRIVRTHVFMQTEVENSTS